MRNLIAPFAAALSVTVISGVASAQFRTVALSGQVAPTVTSQAYQYSAFFEVPAINDAGQVAFVNSLDELGGVGGGPNAIFLDDAGSTVHLVSDDAPSPTPGNPLYRYLTHPQLADNGDIAFASELDDNTWAIFAIRSGVVETVAQTGSAAPLSGTFTFFNDPKINGQGEIAFVGRYDDPNAAYPYLDTGIFMTQGGAVVPLIREGAPAGDGLVSVRFSETFSFSNAGVVTTGTVAPSVRAFARDAVLAASPGSPASVVAVDDGDAPGGGVFDAFDGPVIGDGGHIGYMGTLKLDPPVIDELNNTGLYGPGSQIARAGEALGDPSSMMYSTFSDDRTAPVINGRGDVVYRARVTDGGFPLSGILYHPAGQSGRLICTALTDIPGIDEIIETIGNPTMNDRGEIVFPITFGNTDEHRALIAFDPVTELLSVVVAEGQVVDVDPDPEVEDFRLIDELEFDPTAMLNNAGTVAFLLEFEDGSEGVFTSQLSPIPEPAGAAVLGLSGWMLAGRRRGA